MARAKLLNEHEIEKHPFQIFFIKGLIIRGLKLFKKNPENYKIYKYMLNGWILSYLREIDDFYNRNHCLKYSNCFVCNSLKGIKNDNIKLKLKRLKRVREIIKHKGLLK